MSDYERYGDYNDTEDDLPKSKNPILILLKLTVALVCFFVIGVLVFRMALFNSYPKSVANIYYNDALASYYASVGGDIGAKTQDLRAPYSDNIHGYFFCDCLILIEQINQVQVTVRYNKASVGYIGEELSLPITDEGEPIFSYRLADNYGNIYELSDSIFDVRAMYRYEKLVFDGVDFSTKKGDMPNWIRLEVFVPGYESDEPYACVAIYENNDNYSRFSDYVLSKKEIMK